MNSGILYSVIFELRAEREVTVPITMGHLAHAMFLQLLKEYDPGLSARLHNEPGYRPYTISPLRGGKVVGEHRVLRCGQLCYVRITLFDGGLLWHALQTHFLKAETIHVRLGEADFQLVRMLITPTADLMNWAGSTDWQTLFTLSAQSTITLRFCTATAFSLGAHHYCLFPEPIHFFGSLLRVWNRYAPEQMHIEKRAIRESLNKRIAVTGCVLHHAFLHFPHFVQKGFEGWCTYQLNAAQPMAAHLTSLAAFAQYAGVGYKTTMGMGQVRVEFNAASSE